VLGEYLPILLFLIVSTGIAVVLLTVGWLLGPKNPESEKLSPYECGFEAFEDARMKFDVRYYLIAILFIVFDLEIAFLFPWAVVFQEIGCHRHLGHGDLPRHPDHRICLRVEKRRAGMGVIR
jgi:NADH-quinone oxidoreductase subunit A